MSCSILASLKLNGSAAGILPRIGILLFDSQLRIALRIRAEAQGLFVVHCSGLSWGCASQIVNTDVDVWLTDDSHFEMMSSLPSDQHVLVANIEALGRIELLTWCQAVDRKLQELVQKYQRLCDSNRARVAWLLAASAGGLQAVRAFLEGLDAFYGVAFVYAQHIVAEQANQLVKMIASRTPWHAQMALDGNRLMIGTVTVMCPSQRVALSNGLVSNSGSCWPGPYAPNIDAVAAELANEYGPNCGMIVFSGMGDDGVVGSRLIREKGGSVLVQSPSDCTVPALSEAVIKDGVFDTSGNIQQLQEAFIKRLNVSHANSSVGSKGVLCGRE